MAHRVYLVEDHELMREMLTEFLSIEGDLEICGMASSGESALMELEHLRPDIVLVDMSLPEMSGLDFVRELSARLPEVPCLMFSGRGERTCVELALQAGARGYIRKGNPEELTKAIRTVLIRDAASGAGTD